MSYVFVGLLGLGAGVLSGLFGVGGGVVMVPAMVLLLRLDQHTANGTSLAALLLPVGLLGVLEYHRRGQVNVSFAVLLGIGLLVGVLLGAKLAGTIPEPTLRRAFGALLLLLSVKFLVS